MNKLLIATLSVGALSLGAANAADLRAPVKAPHRSQSRRPAHSSVASMSAFMVATATTGMTTPIGATSRKRSTMTFRRSANIADGSWLGGGQIGWNWQRNCTVFGFEADWSWSGMKAGETFFDGDAGTQDSLSIESKLRWFGTARTRAGIVVDNLLVYVTGGFAYANFKRFVDAVRGCAGHHGHVQQQQHALGLDRGLRYRVGLERQLEHQERSDVHALRQPRRDHHRHNLRRHQFRRAGPGL